MTLSLTIPQTTAYLIESGLMVNDGFIMANLLITFPVGTRQITAEIEAWINRQDGSNFFCAETTRGLDDRQREEEEVNRFLITHGGQIANALEEKIMTLDVHPATSE